MDMGNGVGVMKRKGGDGRLSVLWEGGVVPVMDNGPGSAF